MVFKNLLTCVVDLTVQLLCVIRLKHNLALDQVFHGALHQRIWLLTLRCSVVNRGWLVIFHQQLLLDMLGKERLLKRIRAIIGATTNDLGYWISMRVATWHLVHLSHVCNYFRIITYLLLLILNIMSSSGSSHTIRTGTILAVNAIHLLLLQLHLRLLLAVLLEWIIDPVPFHETRLRLIMSDNFFNI